MSTTTPRPGAPARLAQDFERTFGISARWPRIGRRVSLGLAIAAILATGAAAAAWQVNDQRAVSELQRIRQGVGGGTSANAVGELQSLNSKLQLDIRSGGETADVLEAPTGDGRLDSAPTASMARIETLCPTGPSTTLGEQQRLLCQELVRTELAQYAFSMKMFERAAEHHRKLQEIEQRRRGLGEKDYGDLQYNTNELLALTALMDNERDRYQTYMRAYEARIAHIKHAQVALTRNAFKGGGGLTLPVSL
ncbi:hypothetical protein [Luteimonas deserti]|uniref:Uncharacterized protein n=1 Tax=Luteimonas deserti TaxID=2752306 RepID=A0A7Z0TU26_9GAMM|nr:hypothetical protein [Luteimonas deserti]NYZ62421.1 hypothetical protein [Luteimonas deserti]